MDKPMRRLNAKMVRLVFPSSRTKNTNALESEININTIVIIMIVLMNICYTPSIAATWVLKRT